MAKIEILDYITLGLTTGLVSTSWVVSLDAEMTDVIDRSIEDKENLFTWITPLRKKDGTGYYKNLTNLYVHIRLHYAESESDWFTTSRTQRKQNVEVSHPDGTKTIFDTENINFNYIGT